MKHLKAFKLFENNDNNKPEPKYPVNFKCLDVMSAMNEIEKKFGFHLTEVPAKGSKYGTMNFFRWCGENLDPIYPKYTLTDHHHNFQKKKFDGTGIPITKYKYFERMGVYEIPMRYDSSQDLDKWTKMKNKFRENMTKMAKMAGKEYNIDDEKYVDFGPKSNDWVNLALDKFYELYKEHYKDGKLLIWNDDDEYDRHKQQWDYPMDKAYFLSEIEYWIEDTFEIDTTGFYEWILDCQYIEGRYWENTWMYDLEDINFRKEIANDNIITINDIIKKIFKVESMNIYMDYYKEYKRED